MDRMCSCTSRSLNSTTLHAGRAGDSARRRWPIPSREKETITAPCNPTVIPTPATALWKREKKNRGKSIQIQSNLVETRSYLVSLHKIESNPLKSS